MPKLAQHDTAGSAEAGSFGLRLDGGQFSMGRSFSQLVQNQRDGVEPTGEPDIMPRAVRSDAEIDGDLQRIRQEQAQNVETVRQVRSQPGDS